MTELQKIEQVLNTHSDPSRDALIPILQQVQEACGYISRQAIEKIGAHLKLPSSKIYGVATFYNQFRFHPQGKYHITVCRGTACHVKGSAMVLDTLQRELQIEAGETTTDGMFSLEVVACIGACGLAPLIAVNEDFHGGVTPAKINKILKGYRKTAAKETADERSH
jgi:NADH-quinone oxidoreductase subunit E